jgi:hypothetical protein
MVRASASVSAAPSSTKPLFEVRPGQGAWWLAGTFCGYFQWRLDYPERVEAVVNPSTAAADSLPRVLPRVTDGFGDS